MVNIKILFFFIGLQVARTLASPVEATATNTALATVQEAPINASFDPITFGGPKAELAPEQKACTFYALDYL
ncbi:hypothetical protein B0J11DRAFT_583091 [Dendryphion nanum]|uniref:Uncharacterized protein n=1 Tax=Dendryphion nanum TaxID=256645 RepID=A0A9P9IFC4_9PLEO|nr:hypothetical protein B0J11DRAFT_583091 [Dendryphion nanum]